MLSSEQKLQRKSSTSFAAAYSYIPLATTLPLSFPKGLPCLPRHICQKDEYVLHGKFQTTKFFVSSRKQ